MNADARRERRLGKSRARAALDIAVVGAGLSGLTCSRALVAAGHRVRVFEKARGPGGRMATRRAEDLRFDHGAQYFTVRDPSFARAVDSWRGEGLVAPWEAEIAVLGVPETGVGSRSATSGTKRFVGVPGMSAVCRRLAHGLDVGLNTRVARLERVGNRWRLSAEADGAKQGGADLGIYDAVVVSAPAPQTSELLATAAPALAAKAASVDMAPCWAVMASFATPLGLAFDGAFVHGSPLSWLARNASKPARGKAETWVLHGSPEWSRRHLEIDRTDAELRLFEAFRSAVGDSLPRPVHLVAHRWRYALPVEPLRESCLLDSAVMLGACGDWCGGPRVEGAFLSGSAVAAGLLEAFESD